jgi:hypothetical protein
MTNLNQKPRGWSTVRRQLSTWDKAALLALIKDLYDTAGVNRDFIHARCQVGETQDDILEVYRKKIVDQFYPARGIGKLKLAEARRAIREYRKATGNIAGVADLLMTYVENGTQFTQEYGDIDERFYDSLESALTELADLIRDEPQALYPQFSDRLASLEKLADGIGWGFHDFVRDVVWNLEAEFGSQ